MKISAVSDVHVKKPGDEADKFLCRFLDHEVVQNSDIVLLLGDIFDLMCGPHQQYLADYQHIFDRLEKLRQNGAQVHYIEGNHDVHLDKLFQKFWKKGELVPRQRPLIQTIEGKSYYFSHGDEHEPDNVAYQRYMRTIHSPPLKFLANYLMPYQVLKFIGERASDKSRKKGSRIFNESAVKETFRQGVQTSTEGKFDFVLGGHSHVKDIFEFGSRPCRYINNGYALKSGTFIHIDNHEISFVPLM